MVWNELLLILGTFICIAAVIGAAGPQHDSWVITGRRDIRPRNRL